MIAPCTEAKLAENLRWSEIRILRPGDNLKSDWFARYMWEGGRIFLINSGGSHHFAVAKYIAARLGKAVPLSGKLKTYRINAQMVRELCELYEMFVFPDGGAYGEFHNAMRSYRAAFGVYGMPPPYEDSDLVLLSKEDKRPARVAAALREGGAFSFNDYLRRTLADQEAAVEPAVKASADSSTAPAAYRSKRERLAEFVRRLRDERPASSREDALALMKAVVNSVEDQFSGKPATDYRERMHVFGFECDWKDLKSDPCYWDDFASGLHRTSIFHSGKIVITHRGRPDVPVLEKKGVA
ncbi:DUF6685 family protein [Paraburkholderia sp. MM5477-R1]|uniref:DUF6685 family protein n=1 Tax=Paraburkholderia sp. MM5477-R1 TaxID=2991062 RepID=UPI003D209DF5